MIFDLIKEELNNYQKELDVKSKEILEKYYLKDQKDQKEYPIKSKDFANAIRLFTTLVLFLEENKENKIKSNRNNLVNYVFKITKFME